MSRSKRKRSDQDSLEIFPIGGGNEVGRSCIIIRYKGKTVMLDCGLHPGLSGISSLPYFDEIEPESVDLILITHFHVDHCAALPYFLEKTEFRGRVFMTHPTKTIYKLIIQDLIRLSGGNMDDQLYSANDLVNSIKKVETMNYHQIVNHNGIKFWGYNAGHVLGAAMFMIEIAGIKILYTGDFSRREDRHLCAAELPDVHPDVLIIESTYGVQTLPEASEREKIFTETVHNVLKRGGRILLPAFALGRAQELLLILDEYWKKTQSLHNIPVYYASSLAKKCMTVYQTYMHMMNQHIKSQFETENPFCFKHVLNLKSIDEFDDIGPSVVMAAPGMLQDGLSRQLFEMWCTNRKNGIIIPGYAVEGTLAKTIMSEPQEIITKNGQHLPLRSAVHYISFSAHADFSQTNEFVSAVQPSHIILVHGEASEIHRLQSALQRSYPNITVSSPHNCQSVHLNLKSIKLTQVIGQLSESISHDPNHEKPISGLLLSRDFNYQLFSPSELSFHTPLTSTVIFQNLHMIFHPTFYCLKFYLGQIFQFSKTADDIIEIHSSITIKKIEKHENEKNEIILHWQSRPVNDMIVDVILSLLMTLNATYLDNMSDIEEIDSVEKYNDSWICWQNNVTSKINDILQFQANTTFNSLETDDNRKNIFTVKSTDSISNKEDIAEITMSFDHKNQNNAKIELNCSDGKLSDRLYQVIRRMNSAILPLAKKHEDENEE